ncbi:MAG TPA: DUF262 domain-containing protein [Polyangiaceae bacterium]|nr:DUF262 domain-containing protein [Polyangiaceae bacterium]
MPSAAARSRSDVAGTPSLEARPRAEARTIEDLIDEARKGRLRIPRFQRGLKWQADDARLLLDSIYRGYPIGTLLFWQTKALPAQLSFGTVIVDADARADAWWVVDGQQRVTSLVRVLLGSTEDEFHFWFDLDDEAFVRASRTVDEPDRFLPLTEVLDSERLHAWVGERSLSSDRKKAAFRLNKRVREYSVPAYIVETSDEDVLRKIFERTNSTGKALAAADVFNALYGARDAAEPADFEAVLASLKDLQFGEIESQILYRALLAIHDMDAVGGKVPGAFADAPRAFQRSALAMRAAIVFVMGHVGMPNSDLLPYKQPLVALAKFFDRHPEPSARSHELLARWIWRGAWSGAHRGDTVSTRAILDAIDGSEDDTVQRLLASVGKAAPPQEADLPPYNFRNARSKLEVLALLSLGPRHLMTGAGIPASSVNGPDAVAVIDTKDGGRTLANRLVHPPIPEVVRALARAESRIRTSHAVSEPAYAALLAGDRDAFFRIRGDTLREVVRRFLESKAKWGDNDRPPLRALAVVDEG